MENRNSAPLARYIDLLLDAVCAVDKQGRFVFVSAACERIFGYSADEMIGQPMIDMVHPGDRRLADHLIGSVAENALARRADKDKAALFIHRTDGVQQQIDIARQRRGIPVFHGSAWVSR